MKKKEYRDKPETTTLGLQCKCYHPRRQHYQGISWCLHNNWNKSGKCTCPYFEIMENANSRNA